MKAIDVPAKKVDGWILPEMPGKRSKPCYNMSYILTIYLTHHSINQGLYSVTG